MIEGRNLRSIVSQILFVNLFLLSTLRIQVRIVRDDFIVLTKRITKCDLNRYKQEDLRELFPNGDLPEIMVDNYEDNDEVKSFVSQAGAQAEKQNEVTPRKEAEVDDEGYKKKKGKRGRDTWQKTRPRYQKKAFLQ